MNIEKASLFFAVLGIAVLLFLSQKIEPRSIRIGEINDNLLEQHVKIEGNIISSKTYETLTVLTVQDETGEISVVFYNLKENLAGRAEVIGKVKEYYGKLEIEASSIKLK